jgi:hypothetical protein
MSRSPFLSSTKHARTAASSSGHGSSLPPGLCAVAVELPVASDADPCELDVDAAGDWGAVALLLSCDDDDDDSVALTAEEEGDVAVAESSTLEPGTDMPTTSASSTTTSHVAAHTFARRENVGTCDGNIVDVVKEASRSRGDSYRLLRSSSSSSLSPSLRFVLVGDDADDPSASGVGVYTGQMYSSISSSTIAFVAAFAVLLILCCSYRRRKACLLGRRCRHRAESNRVSLVSLKMRTVNWAYSARYSPKKQGTNSIVCPSSSTKEARFVQHGITNYDESRRQSAPTRQRQELIGIPKSQESRGPAVSRHVRKDSASHACTILKGCGISPQSAPSIPTRKADEFVCCAGGRRDSWRMTNAQVLRCGRSARETEGDDCSHLPQRHRYDTETPSAMSVPVHSSFFFDDDAARALEGRSGCGAETVVELRVSGED